MLAAWRPAGQGGGQPGWSQAHRELVGTGQGGSELTASSQLTSMGGDEALRLDCSYIKRVIPETRPSMAPPDTADPSSCFAGLLLPWGSAQSHPGVQSPAQLREPDSVPGAADTDNKTLSLPAGSQGSTCPCHLRVSPNLLWCWDLSRWGDWALPSGSSHPQPSALPPTPTGDSVTTWGAFGSY